MTKELKDVESQFRELVHEHRVELAELRRTRVAITDETWKVLRELTRIYMILASSNQEDARLDARRREWIDDARWPCVRNLVRIDLLADHIELGANRITAYLAGPHTPDDTHAVLLQTAIDTEVALAEMSNIRRDMSLI